MTARTASTRVMWLLTEGPSHQLQWICTSRVGPAAYLALAMHSKVVSLDPATTLLLPGGITMTGAMVSGLPTSPVAEKAKLHGTLLSMEDVKTGT